MFNLKNLVLIGSGLGNLKIIEKLRKIEGNEYRITLVCKERYVLSPGRMSEYMEDEKQFRDISINLGEFAKKYRVDFIEETISNIDFHEKTVTTGKGKILYDALVINKEAFDGENLDEGNIYRTKVSDLVRFRIDLLKSKGATVSILGSGIKEVELAMALRRLSDLRGLKLLIELITEEKDVALELTESTRRFLKRELVLHNVAVHTNTSTATLRNSREETKTLPEHFIVDGIRKDYLNITINGKKEALNTDRFMRLKGEPLVYAMGYGVNFDEIKYKTGVIGTIKEGELIADNIRNEFKGNPLIQNVPKNSSLYMINLGEGNALIEFKSMNFKGRAAGMLREFLMNKIIENKFLEWSNN